MTKHKPNNKFRLILALTVLLLLYSGVPSAFACLFPEHQNYNCSTIRVDSCHSSSHREMATPCCQVETCHHSTRPLHDLGIPEYRTLHKDSYSLVHESKPLTPQCKAGKPFISHFYILPQLSSFSTNSRKPFQSLDSLRTVVLLS